MPDPTPIHHGRVLLSWSFPEFEKHQRTFGWYTLAMVSGIALLIWAIIERNFLFAIIVLIVATIVYRQTVREPADVLFQISEDGVEIGGQAFYEFRELQNFWIIYEPPEVKKIFFTFRGRLRPDLIIPLMDQNPLTVRQILRQYLPEDLERESEPTTETLGRMLKI